MKKFTADGDIRRDYVPWPDPLDDSHDRLDAWLGQLRVAPASAIEWRLEPWFIQGPRITPDVNWMWIPDADGEVLVGESRRRLRVRAGDHVFLPAGSVHIERFPARRRWRMLSIHFSAPVFGGLDFLKLSGFPPRVPGRKCDDPLGSIAERLCREFALRAPGWNGALRAGIEEALFLVLRHHGKLFEKGVDSASDKTRRRLLPVFEQIEARLSDESLSVSDLARIISLSEVRFRHLFREAVGMRPVEFMRARRIEAACRMLAQTDNAVKEVAAACGFADAAFFHRVFRRRMGSTPSAYRRRSEP